MKRFGPFPGPRKETSQETLQQRGSEGSAVRVAPGGVRGTSVSPTSFCASQTGNSKYSALLSSLCSGELSNLRGSVVGNLAFVVGRALEMRVAWVPYHSWLASEVEGEYRRTGCWCWKGHHVFGVCTG